MVREGRILERTDNRMPTCGRLVTFTVVTSFSAGPHASAANMLVEAGCAVRSLPPGADTWTRALVDDYASTADGWLGTFPRVGLPRAVLEAAPRTRVIVSPVIGTEFIDVAAASELGIVVAHGAMPENFDGMAEAGVMLIAALLKALPGKIAAMAAGRWKPVPPGRTVAGTTIGLVGFGRIGHGIAKRLHGWGCTILAHDPHIPVEAIIAAGAIPSELDDLLDRSDVVLPLLTLTEDTWHLIDARAIARMKSGAFLINIGRGGCIDEAALLAALDEGRLAGAAIDTWETEPLPADHPLRRHPKVIATAHVVGHSDELYATIPRVAADNMLRALHGEAPRYICNPAVLSRWRERLAEMDNG